ncbi:unnamed protein product (macronuclear) [Paramecium tetraurelia]|uniref:Kinesin-associated protein n=1 Tax=Paramecium tetraurelia TaxID=5888 RepID=A0BQ78_PARTE|nr:uncharacterized protein GSPATT00005446001 [Paramecium tetraurelia]CAK60695.1 unnamed protein product [Paramecium tetraurelia]|eukprot:XP_001428093.1 hypothetical protein (macronuclear) [Paramecium tetraurelia strain d4-2]
MDPEEQLEKLLEVFYDEKIEPKKEAAKQILGLATQQQNLEYLISHEQLLSTLSRTLRDEHKKSTELTLYLLCVFYILSNYLEFHQILSEHQIGDITMKIIESQIQRFDLRYAELMEKQGQPQQFQELRKLNLMIAKQEKLFYVGFTILMNMAEDPIIENKMRKRKIITFLLRMLERNNFYLLIVTLLFLKKLSIVNECKLQMIEENCIRKLKRFFSADNNVLLQLSLGLLKNLCFDTEARSQIEQNGFIPDIVKLLKIPNYRFVSIVLLYLLTLDDKLRLTFGFTECMSLVVKLMLHFPEPIIGKELIALATNLSTSSRNVDHITEQEFQQIVQRALTNGDTLLFRFIKGIIENSTNPEIQTCAKGFVRHFMKLLLTQGKEEDLKFEIIGIVSVIQLNENWVKLLTEPFIEFLHNNLAIGVVDDDIVLETMMLVSQIASNAKAAEILVNSNILNALTQVFTEKVDDDEFIVQYLYSLHQFLFHKIGISQILAQDDILLQLIQQLNDKNQKVKQMSQEVLDILREYDQELCEKIKETKFCEYNQLWVEHINEQEMMLQEGVDMGFEDEYGGNELDPKMWDSDND